MINFAPPQPFHLVDLHRHPFLDNSMHLAVPLDLTSTNSRANRGGNHLPVCLAQVCLVDFLSWWKSIAGCMAFLKELWQSSKHREDHKCAEICFLEHATFSVWLPEIKLPTIAHRRSCNGSLCSEAVAHKIYIQKRVKFWLRQICAARFAKVEGPCLQQFTASHCRYPVRKSNLRSSTLSSLRSFVGCEASARSVLRVSLYLETGEGSRLVYKRRCQRHFLSLSSTKHIWPQTTQKGSTSSRSSSPSNDSDNHCAFIRH